MVKKIKEYHIICNNKKIWNQKSIFLAQLYNVEIYLKQRNKYKLLKKIHKNCTQCNEKNIKKGVFKVNNIIWDDDIFHYIKYHNIYPSDDFINYIFSFKIPRKKISNNIITRLIGNKYTIDNLQYININRNQLMIIDALFKNGGYTKKYVDKLDKTIFRYSEHAGLLDFNNNGLEKIIVNGLDSRKVKNNDDILFPAKMYDAYDYEYIFHTHPPTPNVGGRVKDGLLYEVPSIGDLFHFIKHHNDGRAQGSLVITSEGLYNIRTLEMTLLKLNPDFKKLHKNYNNIMQDSQYDAIHKYGIYFTEKVFHEVIAYDFTVINKINKCLEEFKIHIDYYPRIKDEMKNWILQEMYLPINIVELNNKIK